MRGFRVLRAALFAAVLSIFLLTAGGAFAQPASTWAQVNTSGFGNANNMAVSGLIVYNGKYYASTINSATGGEIWTSIDGTHWAKVATPSITQINNNYAILAMTEFGGKLYVSTGWGGYDGQIWQFDGTNWTKIIDDTTVNAFTTFVAFNGKLYVGTAVLRTHGLGASIYVSDTGEAGTWRAALTNGNTNANAYTVTSFEIFNGQLYAAVADDVDGVEVWRTPDGTNWTRVAANGFGDANNQDTGGMAVFNGQLYLGVRNGSLINPAIQSTGGKLYRTFDGTTWSQVIGNGFGDVQNEKIEAVFTDNGWLIVTTLNSDTGMQVWSSTDGVHFGNIATTGFGDKNNINTMWNSAVIVLNNNALFMGTWNLVEGGQIWTYTPPSPLSAFRISLPMVGNQ